MKYTLMMDNYDNTGLPIYRFEGDKQQLISQVKDFPEGFFMTTDGIYKWSMEPVLSPTQKE